MTNEERFEADLRRRELTTEFATEEEFIRFSIHNFCFYPYGFGYRIAQQLNTEEQLKDFILKCGLIELWQNHWAPWFMAEDVNGDEFEWKEGIEFDPKSFRSRKGYEIDYNPYQATNGKCGIQVYRSSRIKIIRPEIFTVHKDLTERLPAVVMFTSSDTFDRCGDIRGADLAIIPLKDIIHSAPMFF